jgi:pimeloyl-ACP methyl ester carboxylesterase
MKTTKSISKGIADFSIDVSRDVIDDLKRRLRYTRWPDEVHNAEWEYGTSLHYMKNFVKYWIEKYDWRIQEIYLNNLPQYHTRIDGFNIHFIHIRGKAERSVPLLLLHGFPETCFKMLKLIPMLTGPGKFDKSFSFDLIIPSLPGFGFSEKPSAKGFSVEAVADLMNKLMVEKLDYSNYGVHGGDWGSSITEQLAIRHPHRLIGIHMTDIPFWRMFTMNPGDLSPAEKDFMQRGQQWQLKEGAYGLIQATEPQTLSYGLNDSPAGLAAWILNKFRKWSDCNGDLGNKFSKDDLITNIMIYWITQSINSASRYYFESNKKHPTNNLRIGTPTGVAIFPKDLVPAPREFGERFYNIRSWTEMPRGGHFAAMEEPELLAKDIWNFFYQVNSQN